MSASEATSWLRDFLHGTQGFLPEMVGSHSCKSTLLTWAGRSFKVSFSPSERRLLGHHLDPGMKSVLCYSRESFTSLYAKVLSMLRLIRVGEFNPDQSALERVVQLADGPESDVPNSAMQDETGADSDSDSSLASEDGMDVHDNSDVAAPEHCISLFPDFPGVPESALFVHSHSGLVHVANEDDVLLCGRPTSVNFRPYPKVTERTHLASCSQCLKSFQQRKG